MAFAIRRCLVKLNNANKSRKLSVFSRTGQNYNNTSQTPNKLFSCARGRQIQTTASVYKIVAFKLSDIGEGIREVVVKEWFVKVGDKVQQFDNVCEVQSDKAAVTITSRFDGVVTKLYHEVDQIALVGQPLMDIDTEDAEDEVSSSSSGSDIESKPVTEQDNLNRQRTKVLTTPSVRRIASQYKVDISTVRATGKNGRILKEDILSHLNISSDKSNEVTTIEAKPIPFIQAQAKTEVLLEDKVVPITGFTRAMVKSMTEAMKIPHFGFCDEYNVTKLVELRDSLKNLAKEKGVKLTYMPIIIKASSLSLAKYPIINSSLDDKGENLIYKASHNIGVAMDTSNGLVVPVLKNVQSKSIMEIAQELNNLQEKGLQGKLGLNDLSGGTFTISNIGIVGGTYTKPIIFPPQVSIGALGKIQVLLQEENSYNVPVNALRNPVTTWRLPLQVLPRFDMQGDLVKAHILSVSWSADHRVVDGVTMARFSNQLKNYLENPNTLLLDI